MLLNTVYFDRRLIVRFSAVTELFCCCYV